MAKKPKRVSFFLKENQKLYVQERLSIEKQSLPHTASTINVFMSKQYQKAYCESWKQHMPHFMEVAMALGIPFSLHFRGITVK